jgi:uncharacterized membrane protein YfcA
MLSLLTGFAAGSLHVVAGPDHIAALVPLALRDRRAAVKTGAAWGLGHGVGVVMLGGVGIAARHLIDVEALSAYSELFVGFLLVMIGLWAIQRSTRLVVHSHHHDHRGDGHAHPHLHAGKLVHEHPGSHARHTHAAFGVGMVHGAAGTGHLFGVVPSLALPPAQAALYLAAYLCAAVLAMAGIGAIMGAIAKRSSSRALRRLMVGAGVAAIVIGVVWVANSWHLVA